MNTTAQADLHSNKAEKRQVFTVPGSSLGLKIGNGVAPSARITRGLSYQALARFQRTSQLPMETITKVIQLPLRTLARRKIAGKLSRGESERLVRLSLVFEKATNLFEGEKAAARAWLYKPCKALGNTPPLVAAETELGARAVEDLIGQLEHGVFP
jgi:putative toxin-antitoxin system antitoxin component (TIGR02293 family)